MNQYRFAKRFALATILLAVIGSPASFGATIFAILQDANANLGGTGDNFTLGYEFVTGLQTLSVTSLGTWDGDGTDDGTDGLLASHVVGIWNNTGTLLGSVTVPAGTSGSDKIGEYRYVDLSSPVVLAANTHYRVGSQVLGDIYHASIFDDFGANNDHVDPDWPVFGTPDVDFVERWGVAGAGLNFPNDLNGAGISSAWDAPNFHTALLPEPAIGAIALGLLSMKRARRTRH
jgi:hypothetical protein